MEIGVDRGCRPIEQQLAVDGPAEETLESNLAIVSEVLGQPEQNPWLEEEVLNLDRFCAPHDQPDASVARFTCQDLRNSEGQQVTLQPVKLDLA